MFYVCIGSLNKEQHNTYGGQVTRRVRHRKILFKFS